ncbi:MAG: aminotransferase class IV [Dehalococcoidales bacterium]|nr:aminotransferase class IV [Dehalococcoidales bacterium]
MEEIVYLNGAMIPRNEAKIPAMDYSFLFGYGLFETMRAYNGVVFRLDSHIARLAKSALGLGIAVDTNLLKNAVTDTIKMNELIDARVRLTVSVGEGSPVPDLRTCQRPIVLVVATKYCLYPQEIYERGFSMIISTIRRNSQSPVSGMKTTNYMESLLARQEAKNAGVDDALFLNEKGHIAENSASNIFLISENAIMTPRRESGILPGITRDVILEMTPQLSITIFEADIRPEEIVEAEEAFLTNSILEIMPITNLGGKAIGDGIPGPITRQLMTAYKKLVIRETRQ